MSQSFAVGLPLADPIVIEARAYWLEDGKLASHIMVITPSDALSARVKAWVNQGGSAVGFDMEVSTQVTFYEMIDN